MELRSRLIKCIVPGCGKNNRDNSDLIFLNFPQNLDRCRKWQEVLKLEEIKKHSSNRCCELHFDLPNDAENWMFYKTAGAKIFLKTEVVPHLNLESTPNVYTSQLTDSSKKRKLDFKRTDDNLKSRKQLFVKYIDIAVPGTSKSPAFVNVDDNRILVPVDTSFSSETATKSSSSFLQESTSSDSSSTASELHDEDLKIEQEKRRNSTLHIIKMDSRFFLGLPKSTYYLVTHLAKWSQVEERKILLTFKKIRLDDQNKRLAYDFGLSETLVSTLFSSSLPKLSFILRLNIYWPTSTIMQLNLPIPFRYRFSKVESIIDCLEVEIEKPTDALQQTLTGLSIKNATHLNSWCLLVDE